MTNIKVLDCTLRDGGYINDWDFNIKNIKNIISNLVLTSVDFIECGFLKKCIYNENKSWFSKVEDLENIISNINSNTEYTLMINFGEYDLDLLPDCKNKNIAIRVVFKKNNIIEALDYCCQLKNKGYKVFVNPMHTNSYSYKELLELIDKVNNIEPYAFTIVDTTGVMREKDILSFFYLIDNNLDKNIALGFHSHNNLQLSFSNAQCLMKICRERELIIDSTVFGMGRGAGNLCTELITQYINDNYDGKYNILPLLKIVDEQINPIFAKTPWGYSVPYYLAATNHCHPNYAKYLVDKQTVPVEIINYLLQRIPQDKKSSFDINLIKQIYLDNFSKIINDTDVLAFLKQQLENRKILLLAPGKSLINEKNTISKFITQEKPYIISLNFESKLFNEDLIFITNLKRFSSLDSVNKHLIVTSNIENIPSNAKILNYSSYINNSNMFDNAALMLLKILIKIGIKEVCTAGLDGFSEIVTENYFDSNLINNSKIDLVKLKNKTMSEELKKYSKKIKINFITKSIYNIE